LKSNFQSAAIWFVENKDKTLDDILVERWKEKCSDTASKKEKRKSCVSAALAEGEDDTPEEKLVKDALKSLLEEDSDEVYEFLSRSSSRTFRDIENDGETHDLGAGTEKVCQTQEGNRRTKRTPEEEEEEEEGGWDAKPKGCVWVLKGYGNTLKKAPDTPGVAEPFLNRHVMTDKAFEGLYEQDLTKPGFKSTLDQFRTFHGEPPADKNTIIKHGDVKELVKEENSEWVGGYRQSLKKIQIIQVEKESAKQYEAHVRFAIDDYGNINHMEPPAPGA